MCNHHHHKPFSRREFLTKSSLGMGSVALASLMNPLGLFGQTPSGIVTGPHFTPRVKRIIYLYMVGAPSQLDLFDYKPQIVKMDGQDLPPSILGERTTGTAATQASLPLVGTRWDFKQHGQSGMWMSSLLPHMSQITDELCKIKSVYTESVQHEPAQMFTNTGSELAGRPSMGAWLNYGLGSDNEDLPAYIVMQTSGFEGAFKGLYSSGFLPAKYEGVKFRGAKDPVLYLNNPPGVSEGLRREQLNSLNELHNQSFDFWEDEGIKSKIAQYEMAFKMQTSVPEAVSIDNEPDYIFDQYGPDSKKPGTFARNCLTARRLAERGVKFIQVYHGGWDHHEDLPKEIEKRAKEVDQASAALILDLKQRGLLEDTLVVWGGEFGRTSFSEGEITKTSFGRDHHPDAFTILMAGAGVKKGFVYGQTDEFGYHIVENPMHVHDLNATLLHLMGIDHERLTYKYKGRRFRLTDVEGEVAHGILS